MPATPPTVGLIGLDSSHTVAFTKLLHQPSDGSPPIARVVCAWPGGTDAWPLSTDRVPRFQRTLVEEHGVQILSSPRDVAERVDLVFITAIDARQHRALLENVLPAGKPVFIDKPFATTLADANAMLAAADAARVALASCSALRYAVGFHAALEACGGASQVTHVEIDGPLTFEPALPGLFWYGCHAVEMLVAALGPGAAEITRETPPGLEVYRFTWPDGRTGVYRGHLGGDVPFTGHVTGPLGSHKFDASAGQPGFYEAMLQRIVPALLDHRSDVPPAEMREVVRLIERCNATRSIA